MTYFTDSPFERMMTQRPRSNPGPSAGKRPPAPNPECRRCPYGAAKPCVGVCIRVLTDKDTKDICLRDSRSLHLADKKQAPK